VNPVHNRPDAPGKLVCLTFDDGPSESTPAVLEVLREHAVRATFFVLGEAIEGREEVLAQTLADGHEVGNHTYSHPHAMDLDDAELGHDIARCQRLLGGAPTLFRPPYGEDALRSTRVAAERGIPTTVLWSVDPRDYMERDPAAIADAIVDGAGAGAIVDLHDGWPRVTSTVPDRTPTARALAMAVPRLAGLGYRFVTVSELLAA
jgi:peptidoglycan/xylan/chitin deacetylase (PgdA/CDA1 family)